MFGGLMKALKAPVKVAQKLPGMGAVNKGVQAAPGVGGMMGKLGLGPSKPPSTVGQPLGPINGQAPPQQPMQPMQPDMQGPPPEQMNQMNQMPPQVGPPPPNTGGPDVNAMMALKQGAGQGIGPSFGQQPQPRQIPPQQQDPRKMGMMGRVNQMRNPRMM